MRARGISPSKRCRVISRDISAVQTGAGQRMADPHLELTLDALSGFSVDRLRHPNRGMLSADESDVGWRPKARLRAGKSTDRVPPHVAEIRNRQRFYMPGEIWPERAELF